jgi:hypothetical protein
MRISPETFALLSSFGEPMAAGGWDTYYTACLGAREPSKLEIWWSADDICMWEND